MVLKSCLKLTPELTSQSESEAKRLNTVIKDTTKILTGPRKRQLDVCGFKAKLSTKDRSAEQVIYVVKGLRLPLLGKPAIEALKIVSLVHNLHTSTDEIPDKFPQVFQGLGKLDGEHSIDLKEDARPYAVTTPRRVPLPLIDKVKEELAKMEEQGVISKIDKPTDWCAPMVVVPKRNDKFRICVDFTKLNDCV